MNATHGQETKNRGIRHKPGGQRDAGLQPVLAAAARRFRLPVVASVF
jgi:hypothetical protein